MVTITHRWITAEPIEPPAELLDIAGHPLVAALLWRRGLRTPEAVRAFLEPAWYQPASPWVLPDVDRAADRVVRAVKNGEHIWVWGDFDVDGQSATALLVLALRTLGAQVDFYIPERASEGHGLHAAGVRHLAGQGADLIVTCDCGVSAHAAVEEATRLGLDVVITDHHELPANLPPALAVVNPKRFNEAGHPLRELTGAGVAYQLIQAIYDQWGQPDDAEAYLDLTALGTVADVGLLVADNRYVVQRGLATLIEAPRTGIHAIYRTAGFEPTEPDTDVIGFLIGPRLNAAGRLAHAGPAVRLLMTNDWDEALRLARDLELLNEQRKLLCENVEREAKRLIRSMDRDDGDPLVLVGDGWHPGVIGIVAGRLAERYAVPAILITRQPKGPALGSARSVVGCDVYRAITAHHGFLLSGGGHPMAAGFSLAPERIEAFRVAVSRTLRDLLPADRAGVLRIDGWLTGLHQVDLEFTQSLARLGPFGPGNPRPVLACAGVTIEWAEALGEEGAHFRLRCRDQAGAVAEAVWWHAHGEAFGGAPGKLSVGPVDLAFHVVTDTWNQMTRVRLEVVDLHEGARPPAEVVVAGVGSLEAELGPRDGLGLQTTPNVVDHRERVDRDAILAGLYHTFGNDVQVWAEGLTGPRPEGARHRQAVEPAHCLVIWTPPPAPEVLREALDRVRPQQVVLLTQRSVSDAGSVVHFLAQLAGALREALCAGPLVDVEILAAQLGQRTETVILGLQTLSTHQKLRCHRWGRRWHIEPGPGGQAYPQAQAQLARALAETAAYRRWFQRAEASRLIH